MPADLADCSRQPDWIQRRQHGRGLGRHALPQRGRHAGHLYQEESGGAGLGAIGEVIVADNGSTDGSQDIARRLGARSSK